MITFVTCWYELHSKYNKELYQKWIDNFLSNLEICNLVIYTNIQSVVMLKKYEKKNNIQIILLELDELYNYKYKDDWIMNHERNHTLNTKTCWELNMLWNEKTHFVEKAYINNHFQSDWYGWCDIGYFRGRPCDTNLEQIKRWPNPNKIRELNMDKIYYGNVNGNIQRTYQIYKQIQDKNEIGLPRIPIPTEEIFIAAGFFLIYKNNIRWWNKTHDEKLRLYFENKYLVKDDQMIVLNNIVDNIHKIQIQVEFTEGKFDNWFMFQRILL